MQMGIWRAEGREFVYVQVVSLLNRGILLGLQAGIMAWVS
jgi:hypothetical protein